MAIVRLLSRPDADIRVRLFLRMFLGPVLLTLAACSEVGGDPEGLDAGDPEGPSASDPVTIKGASAVLTAYMYADRPTRLELTDAAPFSVTPDASGSEFRMMIGLSNAGAVVGTVTAPRGCTEPPVVAGGGDTLLVPSETYPTIQSAVDAAAPGDVVFVNAGTYHESVHLRSNVSLVGAGAPTTIIDGDGDATSLIDYTDAKNAVVSGFTLAGVGRATGCADPDDVFACSGNWYAAAIYGDGHWDGSGTQSDDPCEGPSVLVTHNIIRGNVIGMMAYFHARAVVANNIFVGNEHAFVATYLGDNALVMQNVFYDNQELSIGSSGAYLDIVGNLIAASKTGVVHKYTEMGGISCNAFAGVQTIGGRVPVGEQGNLDVTAAFVDAASGDFSPTPELVTALYGCLGGNAALAPWSIAAPGAYGGVLGVWN